MRVTREIKSKVRGTTFRYIDFQAIRPGDGLELRREPDNLADPQAVKVLHQDKHVGYLGRHLAAEVAPAMDAGLSAVATVEAITGGLDGAKNFGINVTVTLAEDFGEAMFRAPATAS